MEQEEKKVLVKIQSTLEQMLLGKPVETIEDTTSTAELNQLTELVNMLGSNMAEMSVFARELAKGNLDLDPPGRRNYVAAPLKELHSQLSSFIWIGQQLQKGRIVGKLDYMGELSATLNGLIDKVAVSIGLIEADMEEEEGFSSWKYHQLLLAFNHLHVMVLVVDISGRVVFANRPATEHFKNLEYLREADIHEDSPLLEANLASFSNESATFPVFQEVFDEGAGSWYKITSDQITFPDGTPVYLHSVEDISEWKNSETELKISATVDQLTGVFNRNVGLKALESAMNNPTGMISCAAFIDIDGLKAINDNYGHNEGDYAIYTIADTLLSSVRDTDTVSRFGGDEFLIVFPGCKQDAAERVVSRMFDRIHAINESNLKAYNLAFSYGIAQIDPAVSTNVKDLIMLMDKKMYERKQAKKARPSTMAASSETVSKQS